MARKRLIWQLFPAFLVITVLSVVLVAYFVTESFDRLQTNDTERDLSARAALVRTFASQEGVRDNVELLRRKCELLGEEIGTRITIIESDGRVLIDTGEEPSDMDNHADRPEVRAALEGVRGHSIRFSDTVGMRMMYVALPENSLPGSRVYRVAVPLAAIGETLKTTYWRLGLVVAGVCLLAAMLSWAVSRRIMRPLADLKVGAERFAQGKLDQPLAVTASEEIASLAGAMNEMADQLADRIRAVEQQRNEMEAVFSSMIESVLAVDSELRVISINQAAISLLGVQPSAIKGRPILESIRNAALHNFARSALASEGVAEAELTVEHKDSLLLKAQGTVLRDGAGKAMGAVIVLHDITRLRRLEEVRQDFVANVSHELKTPITSIKGFVETLLDDPPPSTEDTRRFLGIIEKQANRLDAIIEDLLALSRLEQGTGNVALATERATVLSVVEAAAELCQQQAGARQIQLQIECPEDLAAPLNPPLLEQGLVNLINNAIKYSDEGQSVYVRAYVAPPSLIIEVADQGAGIHANELERIFERFYRIDKARSRDLGGTGLGLSIVKHIAQAHRGTVSVASTPGTGSTFTLRLPLGTA